MKNLTQKWAIATGILTVGLMAVESTFTVASAAQQLTCTGQMSNGRAYTADFVNGFFTQIRWTQAGQPPQTTELAFETINVYGQPIYRGSFQAATAVTLIDLSGGNVQPGSEISVGVQEWGWSRGTCATSSASNSTTSTVSAVRQNLLGLDQV